MKAPDKIYVLMDESTGFLSHTFTNAPCEYGGEKKDVEYIRKDALMEWAKQKQYESLTIVADNFWQEVIDKLNNL